MPHRRTLRRALVDDQMVDQAVANPVPPVQRGVAERRSEHIAARGADTEPAPLARQRVARLGKQHREIATEVVAPGLHVERLAANVDSELSTEISNRGLIEPEVVGAIDGPRLRAQTEEEPGERRWREQRQP